MPRGFEVLKMIHQSPKVLTKIRVWDFIKISWEFWSETLYMASICLEDHMFEVLIINFEGKWINWFRGAKWSFWSKSVKVKVDQVNFWSTINSRVYFSYFKSILVIGSKRLRFGLKLVHEETLKVSNFGKWGLNFKNSYFIHLWSKKCKWNMLGKIRGWYFISFWSHVQIGKESRVMVFGSSCLKLKL